MFLQMGLPGGIELMVILVMGLILFGLPLVLIAVVGALWLRSDDDYDERIRQLETEIARLNAQVGDGDAAADDFAAPEEDSGADTDGGQSADTDGGHQGRSDG